MLSFEKDSWLQLNISPSAPLSLHYPYMQNIDGSFQKCYFLFVSELFVTTKASVRDSATLTLYFVSAYVIFINRISFLGVLIASRKSYNLPLRKLSNVFPKSINTTIFNMQHLVLLVFFFDTRIVLNAMESPSLRCRWKIIRGLGNWWNSGRSRRPNSYDFQEFKYPRYYTLRELLNRFRKRSP